MKKTITILIVMAIPAIFGCQDNPDGGLSITNPESNSSIYFRSPHNIFNPEDPDEQMQLEDIWQSANHDDWEIISGVINPMYGGEIFGVPESWPPGFLFKIEIPDGTEIVSEYGGSIYPRSGKDPVPQPVNFQIHIPKFIPGDPRASVYKLLPDVEFSNPVKVTLCYPPWFQGDDIYTKFCINRAEGDPPVYSMTDYEFLTPAVAQPRGRNFDLHKEITFQTYHFSRWKLKKGRGGD